MVMGYAYDSTIIVEDVSDIISNVAIQDTVLLSSISESDKECSDVQHKGLIDTLAAAADNSRVDGTDPTYAANTDPTKILNYPQILSKPLSMDDTRLSVSTFGNVNWEYHIVKKTIELKKDIEYAMLFGTGVAGNNTVARKMKGLIAFISTYKDGSRFLSVQLSATIFRYLAQQVWTNSNVLGGAVLVGAYQKSRISETFASFDSSALRNVVINGRTVSMPIDRVVTDFGDYEVKLSHNMNADKPRAVVAYNPDHVKFAYMQQGGAPYTWRPTAREYMRTGLARKGEVITQLTLEQRNELTSGMIDGLRND